MTDQSDQNKILIKKFVISISKPLSLDENLSLINEILKEIKNGKFTNDELCYVWKGIFYAIWYTEMNKGCENIVENVFNNSTAKFIIAGFDLLNQEWFGIDYIRIDKYMFLVRRLTNKLLNIQFKNFVKFTNEKKNGNKVSKINYTKLALEKMNGVGLLDHFLDIFLAENFKVINPYLDKTSLIKNYLIVLIKTILNKMINNLDDRVINLVRNEILSLFNHLKRHRKLLESTINNIIQYCDNLMEESSIKNQKILSSFKFTLDKKLKEVLLVNKVIGPKVKLTYNRKKALKNKNIKLNNKKRKLKAKKLMELSKSPKIETLEDQFNMLIGSN